MASAFSSSSGAGGASALSASGLHELPVVVVGAGLAGTLSALLLAKRGLPVTLLEFREDFRVKERHDEGDKLTSSLKRSVNLALSFRGISALKRAGIFDAIQPHLIPMKGRFIHKAESAAAAAPGAAGSAVPIVFQAYGVGDEAIYSISRALINKLLLDQLSRFPSLRTLFEVKVSRVERDGTVYYRLPGQTFATEQSIRARFVVGADGAFSVTRSSLLRYDRIDYSLTYIAHGYKELTIPPTASGDFAFDCWQGLHIWPHSDFMLIALPNPDHSFTATLFAPFDGHGGFDTLQTPDQIRAHFQRYFPDALAVMPNLEEDFVQSPASPLITVRTSKFHFQDKLIIIGDAAHAVVPFLGQGMNAAFEDVLVFDELLDAHHGDVAQAMSAFSAVRVPAAQALADLSLANYKEMSHDVASLAFLLEKRMEQALRTVFPTWYVPKYAMVQFTRVPYHVGVQRAQRQRNIVLAAGALTALTLLGSTVLLAARLWSFGRGAQKSGQSKGSVDKAKDVVARAQPHAQAWWDWVAGYVPQLSSASRK